MTNQSLDGTIKELWEFVFEVYENGKFLRQEYVSVGFGVSEEALFRPDLIYKKRLDLEYYARLLVRKRFATTDKKLDFKLVSKEAINMLEDQFDK